MIDSPNRAKTIYSVISKIPLELGQTFSKQFQMNLIQVNEKEGRWGRWQNKSITVDTFASLSLTNSDQSKFVVSSAEVSRDFGITFKNE